MSVHAWRDIVGAIVGLSIQISTAMSLADLESQLQELPGVGSNCAAKLKIDINGNSTLLTDIWAAILSGTLCRRVETEVVYRQIGPDSARFETSLPGLVSASMAKSIHSNENIRLDTNVLKQRLMIEGNGLVSPDSEVVQTLVEFDTRYSVSPLFQTASGTQADKLLRRSLFEKQILQFRQLLDLGMLRRGSRPVKAGPAEYVGQFLAELHENGLEHGSQGLDGPLEGTRFLRLRTHSASDPNELLERCGPFRQLRYYVQRTFRGNDPVSLVEASVSDFGLGIVDAFQASPSGLGPSVDRRELLEQLVYGRLTSKSNDTSAGLGIQDALKAARGMQAFVSLRTAEFWMAASFLNDKPEARLTHLGKSPHAKVSGTHWQILWPQW